MKSVLRCSLALAFICSLALGNLLIEKREANGASKPPVRSFEGIVAADSEIASQIGVQILDQGGNAADAGVAVMATLGLVQPFASGLGGGSFCLFYEHETQQVTAYDFREVAPLGAHANMYLDEYGEPQPELSLYGGLAVGVPGEVAGMQAICEAHGRLGLNETLAPTIDLARNGFVVGTLLEERIASYADRIALSEGLSNLLMPNGVALIEGDLLINDALATTLERISAEGATAFYSGDIAAEIVSVVQEAGGILTLDDLSSYTVATREPSMGTYGGYEIYSMPPPSSGGIAIIEILNILEPYDLLSTGHNASSTLHLIVEATKFAFADRAEFLGDPDFVEVPVDDLTSKDYAATLRTQILTEGVLETDAYGPSRYVKDDSGTSHFSVLDAEGNMMACTTTINTAFGSYVYADELGFVLNNEMDDFVQKPGVANTFGLVGSAANAIEPGKRPLSSMSPTIVLKDGQPVLALGGSGGPTIITATLQVMLNVIVFGLDAREAVEAPRFHHQWLPNVLWLEPEFPRDVADNLGALGHDVQTRESSTAVQIVIAGDPNTAGSDPRKHGEAAGQ